jgi:hypothetical protein
MITGKLTILVTPTTLPCKPCLDRQAALEVVVLDVVVCFRGQLVTAAQTTALQNIAPVSSFHARSKAMHTHAAAFLRLVRSLRHNQSFLRHCQSVSKKNSHPNKPRLDDLFIW